MKKIILLVVFVVAFILFKITSSQEPANNVNESDGSQKNELLKPIQKIEFSKVVPRISQKSNEPKVHNVKNKTQDVKSDKYDAVTMPPEDIALAYAELIKRREKLESKDFTSNNEWNNSFQADTYSEWGVEASESIRNVLDNAVWQERPANLASLECKSRFCKISFSFPDETPIRKRNIIYPDFFDVDVENLSFSSYYDAETGQQNIYAELCTKC